MSKRNLCVGCKREKDPTGRVFCKIVGKEIPHDNSKLLNRKAQSCLSIRKARVRA